MSKAVKAVKRVFKGVGKAVKSVASFAKKHWKEIAVTAAVVFTAGAALGYIGMGAGGGLAFGSSVTTSGLTGVTSAWGALGNTVASAVGLGTPFSGTASVGTGTASFQGGLSGGGGLMGSGTAANAAPAAATPGNVAAAQAPAGAPGPAGMAPAATSSPTNVAAAQSSVANAAPTVAVPEAPALLQPAGQEVAGEVAKQAASGWRPSDYMMAGSLAMQGVGGYFQGQAEEEQLEAQRQQMRWYPGGSDYQFNTLTPMPYSAVPSSGLMRRPSRPRTNMSMDEYVATRYGVQQGG